MFIIGHWSGVYKSTVYMGRENSHVFDTLEVVGSSCHSFERRQKHTSYPSPVVLVEKIMSHDKYEAWTILDIDHRICIFIDPRPSL